MEQVERRNRMRESKIGDKGHRCEWYSSKGEQVSLKGEFM